MSLPEFNSNFNKSNIYNYNNTNNIHNNTNKTLSEINSKKNIVQVFFELFNNKNTKNIKNTIDTTNNIIDNTTNSSSNSNKNFRKNLIVKTFLTKGKTLLKAAQHPQTTIPKNTEIPIEGACEGSLACSTCHVILDKELYNKLKEPVEKEYDLLDTAFMPRDTSRLGCQLIVDSKFKNRVIRIPRASRNFAVDGFINKHH